MLHTACPLQSLQFLFREIVACFSLLILFHILTKSNVGSATSVDVEEHLYGLAKDMRIMVVISSQVTWLYMNIGKKNIAMVNLVN